MSKHKVLKEARKIAGTRVAFSVYVVIHIVVIGYMVARLFYDVPAPNWMLDAAAISYAGVGSVYYVVLIRKLIKLYEQPSP